MRLGVNYDQEPSLFDIILGFSNKKGKKEIVRVLMDFITTIKTQ